VLKGGTVDEVDAAWLVSNIVIVLPQFSEYRVGGSEGGVYPPKELTRRSETGFAPVSGRG
jgi:hypothetical protein